MMKRKILPSLLSLWVGVALLLGSVWAAASSAPVTASGRVGVLVSGPLEEVEYTVLQRPSRDEEEALDLLDRMYDGARWEFYEDGLFRFTPAERGLDLNEAIYPLVGTYSRQREGLFFTAVATVQEAGRVAQATVQGVISLAPERREIWVEYSSIITSLRMRGGDDEVYGYFRFHLQITSAEGAVFAEEVATPTPTRRSLRPSLDTPTATALPAPTEEIPAVILSGNYEGTTKTAIRDLSTGESETYTVPVIVQIGSPVGWHDEVESNPFNLKITPRQAVVGEGEEGGLWIHSAAVLGGTTTIRRLYQFWTLEQEGNRISGVLTDDHQAEGISGLVGNGLDALLDLGLGGQVLWTYSIRSGATLEGTITAEAVHLTIKGSTTSGSLAFEAEVVATRLD